MTSPFANIFTSVMAQLKAEVPELKHIDHDLGQLEGYTNRPEVAFPAVLIDFQNWTFTNLGDNAQMGEGDVVIKLGFAQHLQSSSHFGTTHVEEALTYYEIEQALHEKLQGWSPGDEFGLLTRTAHNAENRPMGIRVCTLRYRLEFEDDSTTPVHGTVWGQ